MTNDLREEFHRFLEAHPEGWGHKDWLRLLERIASRGIDVSDPDSIGLGLERERLVSVLRGLDIKGLGPKRIESIADCFGTIWNLMGADVEEIAAVPGVPRSLAHELSSTLQ